MKAQSLQINLRAPCDAHCPFCVARMTWKPEEKFDNDRLFSSVMRAIDYALHHGVETIMVTSSGEPGLMPSEVTTLVTTTSQQTHGVAVLELQTNGRSWDDDDIRKLKHRGLDTLAISVCSVDARVSSEIMFGDPGAFDYYDRIFHASEAGLTVRVCLNLTDQDGLGTDIQGFAKKVAAAGGHAITFKQLWTPANNRRPEVGDWIAQHAVDQNRAVALQQLLRQQGTPLRELAFGSIVYDVMGLSVTSMSCADARPEKSTGVRALILQPDGHLYHRWDYPGSRIW